MEMFALIETGQRTKVYFSARIQAVKFVSDFSKVHWKVQTQKAFFSFALQVYLRNVL